MVKIQQKIRTKSLIAVCAAVSLAAVSLSGCSTQKATNTTEHAASSSIDSKELTVFAAASLTEAFQEIAKNFEAEYGVKISLNFAGSQTLVDQLDNGAPADVLATANESSMKRASDAKLVNETKAFTSNLLTIITPKGNPAGVTGLDTSLENAKLVICAEKVPCGKATATLTKKLGLTLHPVSEEDKVTDVRSRVISGEADAGIVYKTDAIAAKDAADTVEIAQAGEAVNIYPIAQSVKTVEKHHEKSAQSFINYVLSPKGQKTLTDHGFTPVKQ